MKKLLFVSLSALLMISAGGCKNNASPGKDKTTGEKTASAKDNCLTGTWIYIENDFEKSFTFNDDNTGTEVYAVDDIRQFTWKMKNGSPVIVYKNESAEWAFTLDCEKGELSVFGVVMKKQ